MLVEAAHRLGEGGTSSARLDAELLLAHALGVSRAWLVAHADESADAGAIAALIERRAGGEPLAYIVGFKDFWTLSTRSDTGTCSCRDRKRSCWSNEPWH